MSGVTTRVYTGGPYNPGIALGVVTIGKSPIGMNMGLH